MGQCPELTCIIRGLTTVHLDKTTDTGRKMFALVLSEPVHEFLLYRN